MTYSTQPGAGLITIVLNIQRNSAAISYGGSVACIRAKNEGPTPRTYPDEQLTFADLTAYIATELLFATGMRVSELASLRDTSVDVEDGTITIIGKGNRERRVFVPDEIKSLLSDYRNARDLCATTAETFLVNSRGAAASPQMIRRLIRLHGERSDVRDRVTPSHVPPLGSHLPSRGGRRHPLRPMPPRPPEYLHDGDLHARGGCGAEGEDYGETPPEGDCEYETT